MKIIVTPIQSPAQNPASGRVWSTFFRDIERVTWGEKVVQLFRAGGHRGIHPCHQVLDREDQRRRADDVMLRGSRGFQPTWGGCLAVLGIFAISVAVVAAVAYFALVWMLS